MKMDFLLAGVGGQGIVLASDLLGEVGIAAGLDVKKSDIHGMAQRGGSVVSYVRMAGKVWSPLPRRGEVDYLLALEMLEGARWGSYLTGAGVAILNRRHVFPPAVRSGKARYPGDEEIEAELRRRAGEVYLVDGVELASEVGNPKVVNVLMLGFLSQFLPFDMEVWERVIAERVPARFQEINLAALKQGRAEAEWASGERKDLAQEMRR